MDIDKLMLALVQHKDADAATNALTQAGLSVTRISSLEGFLGTRNVTLLIGLQSDDVQRATALLKSSCSSRIPLGASNEADIGTTTFTFNVNRYIHLTNPAVDFQSQPSEHGAMQMILAIVAQEHSDKLMQALTDWSYRATLISTTGGFLRRGNATVFIGARSERVNSIVDQIRQVCKMNETSDPVATIFVLDISHFERM